MTFGIGLNQTQREREVSEVGIDQEHRRLMCDVRVRRYDASEASRRFAEGLFHDPGAPPTPPESADTAHYARWPATTALTVLYQPAAPEFDETRVNSLARAGRRAKLTRRGASLGLAFRPVIEVDHFCSCQGERTMKPDKSEARCPLTRQVWKPDAATGDSHVVSE